MAACALQKRGNEHFVAKDYLQAATCYDEALQAATGSSDDLQLLVPLLLNLSATHQKLHQPLPALLHAAAAASVSGSGHSSTKACYRAALALDRLAGSSDGSARQQQLAAAAAALMDAAVSLLAEGPDSQEAAALRAALVHASPPGSSARAEAGERGQEWLPACQALAADLPQLHACFTSAAETTASSSNSSSSTDGAAAAKAAGNAAFKRGDQAAALQHYQAAFAALRGSNCAPVPVLLSNRAACWLAMSAGSAPQQPPQQAQLQHAVMDALAAVLLDPGLVKGYYRAASALMQLPGQLPGAARVCDLGLLLRPGEAALASLQQQIKEQAAAADSSKGKGKARQPGRESSSSSSTPQLRQMSEDEWHAERDRDAAGLEQVAMMNEIARMAGRMRGGPRNMPLIDDRVPRLHEEFAQAGRWLPQMDKRQCLHVLAESYELGRALPRHLLMMQDADSLESAHLLQRLGTNDPGLVRAHMSAPWGSVRFLPSEMLQYSGNWQSFVNAPARTEILSFGTTHVAIGFTDLGGLAASCALLAARDPAVGEAAAAAAGNSSDSSQAPRTDNDLPQPLSWVGYEQSACCVAKTLVLLQMMRRGAPVDVLLQAWYSAAWSSATLAAFKSAAAELLSGAAAAAGSGGSSPQVLRLMRYWHRQHVSLAAAQRGWLQRQPTQPVWVANFKRRADRLALCQLVLSGELPLPGQAAEHGSLTMFAVPEEYGGRAHDECFLQTLPYLTLMEQCLKQPGDDVVRVAVGLLRQRVTHLSNMLRAGLVLPEVELASVAPDATATIAAIRALRPYTISWSNVPDYLHPQDFHALARAVSAPADTVHCMHSMNWCLRVKGASHIDAMLSVDDIQLKSFMTQLLKDSQTMLANATRLFGLESLVLAPPIDNPRNVADFAMFAGNYKKWLTAFFAASVGGLADPERQLHVAEPPIYALNSTIHLKFTYDPKITFRALRAANLGGLKI